MIKVNKAAILEPVKKFLKTDPETFVVIKHATLGDEGQRYELAYAGRETVYVADLAAVEMWLTIVETNILDENDQPLFTTGLEFEDFAEAATALYAAAPKAFWEIRDLVREVNPQWVPNDPNA